MLISQGSSEHSICFAVPEAQAERAERSCERAFARAARGPGAARRGRRRLRDHRGRRRRHGRHARHRRQVLRHARQRRHQRARDRAGRVRAQHLGRRSTRRTATRALRAVHTGFYLSPQTVSIGVIGPGTVGGALLDQIASAGASGCARVQPRPARARHRELASACCSTNARSISKRWRDALERDGDAARLERFVDHVQRGPPAASRC